MALLIGTLIAGRAWLRARPLRKAQGMTQVQVAKAMGVTQGRISQIERGGVRLDTSTMATYLQAIGGELTILATVGNASVKL
jgi:transcriptional regulator with XRE-family HTH domain